MDLFRRLRGRDEGPVWYVATIRRRDGKVVDVPFGTSATGQRSVWRKARIAVEREGYLRAVMLNVRRKDA